MATSSSEVYSILLLLLLSTPFAVFVLGSISVHDSEFYLLFPYLSFSLKYKYFMLRYTPFLMEYVCAKPDNTRDFFKGLGTVGSSIPPKCAPSTSTYLWIHRVDVSLYMQLILIIPGFPGRPSPSVNGIFHISYIMGLGLLNTI